MYLKWKIFVFIVYFYILICLFCYKFRYKIKFNCIITNVSKYIRFLADVVKFKNLYFKSYKNYIAFLSEKSQTVYTISRIDSENYSLILIKNVYVTKKVIIFQCKILLFDGECADKKWYSNSIKYKEILSSINFGINIINWHSDGVFHGTVEGLTRIVPYIDFLLNNIKIFIFISYPRYKQNTAEKLLLLLGFSKNRILYGNYHVKNLYIPLPFYCVQSSTPLIVKFNEILRGKILHRNCINSHEKYILIVQRSNNRIIKNLDLIKKELLYNFNYSIIVYYDINNNLDEVYCWFTYAKIVIAYHGSGLTNIYFSNINTVVIEFSPKYPIYAFARIGSQLGLKYYIFKLSNKYLYIKYVYINISSFINSLKYNKVIKCIS